MFSDGIELLKSPHIRTEKKHLRAKKGMKEWAQGKDEDPPRYNHGGVGTGVASILSVSSARELAKRLRIRGKRGGFLDGEDGGKMQALAPISSVEMARDLDIYFLGDANRPVTREVG